MGEAAGRRRGPQHDSPGISCGPRAFPHCNLIDLPVAPAAAVSTAVAPVASASAATVPAAATTASPMPTASAATTTAAFALRTSLIDDQSAAEELLPVERGDGFFRFGIVANLRETEPARLPGETVLQQRE